MSLRFLFSLLALFFLSGIQQQLSGHAVSVAQPVKIYSTRAETGVTSSTLEKAELLKHPALTTQVRSRSTPNAPERLLPDVLFFSPAFVFADVVSPLKDRSASSATALFCFLQSLLYPKHSFW
ncbi:MAG TPA: hypothetical protein VL092_13965 [Chitinophagaceae bacterium]|nr:hypothetical protein [Chitinophagaceae bacterium]